MNFVEFIAQYGHYFYLTAILVGSFCLGYLFGECKSLFDDLKSIDYDRLVEENSSLKRAIDIKKCK